MNNKLIMSEPEKGIIELKLNRPTKYNAVDFDIMDEIKSSLHSLQVRKDLIALVITGEGDKAFCSGGDIEAFRMLKTKEQAYHMLSKMGEVLYELLTFPVPTFALLNGITLGGGCEIAIACDFRIARQGISVGFIQGNLAITTGWGGATMLHEKISYEHAMSILLSAKKLSADEAKSVGFINHVMSNVNYREEAYQFIQEFLIEHPNVLRAYKEVNIIQWEQTKLHSRMMSEINRCAELWSLHDHHEAVSLFLNRDK